MASNSEYNLSYIVNSLFFKRENYKNIPIKYKNQFFFIINRFLSKSFPFKAQTFNKKNIDKSLALDMWFIFLRNEKKRELFKVFWSKNNIDVNKEFTYSKKEIETLKEKLDISQEDFRFLYKYYKEFLKEELKYFKQIK